jgi:hypothetical protein
MATKTYQMDVKYLFQMATKYTNIFYSKALQHVPYIRIWVWKYTIWQPWFLQPLRIK